MMELHLTERAMLDLIEICSYSIEQFGKKVADRYLVEIQNSLSLIQEHPGILQDKKWISEAFTFYPSQKRYLVCTIIAETITVLTVTHAQMDLIDRLTDLEPTLLEEANILHEALKNR